MMSLSNTNFSNKLLNILYKMISLSVTDEQHLCLHSVLITIVNITEKTTLWFYDYVKYVQPVYIQIVLNLFSAAQPSKHNSGAAYRVQLNFNLESTGNCERL
jgi:wyosine [tRNA(Phe)-imidazoG37] synthetase (radical SAM superfamily)